MPRRLIAVVAIAVVAAGAGAAFYFRSRPVETAHPRPPFLQSHYVRQPDAVSDADRKAMDLHEAVLLKEAHEALDAHRPEDAIAAVTRWRLDIRHSSRAEEAEEIKIRALVALGRIDDAQEQLRQFDIKHPHSAETEALRKLLVSPP